MIIIYRNEEPEAGALPETGVSNVSRWNAMHAAGVLIPDADTGPGDRRGLLSIC